MNDLELEQRLRAAVVDFTMVQTMIAYREFRLRQRTARFHAKTFVTKIMHWKRPCPSGSLPGNVRIACKKRIAKQEAHRQHLMWEEREYQRWMRGNNREDD